MYLLSIIGIFCLICMIRNIIFDWSGTLVDDLPVVWKATNHVFAMAGRTQITLDQFRSEFCLPFTLFYDKFVPDIPLTQLEIWFHSHFRKIQDDVQEIPLAREFLEFCRDRGVRMFVLSSVHPDHFRNQQARTAFNKYFERAYTGVMDKRAQIPLILQENALDPRQTLMVGDMQHDIETAHAGGIYGCAVLTGYNQLDQLRASKPHLIVEHLGELQDLLDRAGMEWSALTRSGPMPRESCPPIVTVGALVHNRKNEILLVQTPKWSNLWGIPGGKIKYGETSFNALRREIKEETNLDIESIQLVMVQDCIQPSEFYRSAHFILLNYVCRLTGEAPVILNMESRAYCWTTLSNALKMSLNQPTRLLLDKVLCENIFPPHG